MTIEINNQIKGIKKLVKGSVKIEEENHEKFDYMFQKYLLIVKLVNGKGNIKIILSTQDSHSLG